MSLIFTVLAVSFAAGSQGLPPTQSGYHYVPHNNVPTGISSSVSGTTVVAVGNEIIHTVTSSDSDSFKEYYNNINGFVVVQKGSGSWLNTTPGGNNADPTVGVGFVAQSLVGVTEASRTWEMLYTTSVAQNAMYPLDHMFTYTTVDTAPAAYNPSQPGNNNYLLHDPTPVMLSKTVLIKVQ